MVSCALDNATYYQARIRCFNNGVEDFVSPWSYNGMGGSVLCVGVVQSADINDYTWQLEITVDGSSVIVIQEPSANFYQVANKGIFTGGVTYDDVSGEISGQVECPNFSYWIGVYGGANTVDTLGSLMVHTDSLFETASGDIIDVDGNPNNINPPAALPVVLGLITTAAVPGLGANPNYFVFCSQFTFGDNDLFSLVYALSGTYGYFQTTSINP